MLFLPLIRRAKVSAIREETTDEEADPDVTAWIDLEHSGQVNRYLAVVVTVGSSSNSALLVPGLDTSLSFRFAAVWAVSLRDSAATLLLDGAEVPRSYDKARAVLESGSTHTIQVALRGARHRFRVRVFDGTGAEPAPLRSATSPPANIPSAPPAPTLGASFFHLQAGQSVTIGREGGSADIQIVGEDVADLHAKATWDGERLLLRQLREGTGVFVDGNPVLRIALDGGQSFRVGKHLIHVDEVGVLWFNPTPRAERLVLRRVNIARGAKSQVFVEGLDLAVEAGTLLAVVGPSGAGKSTLCELLLGEAELRSGTVHFDGDNLVGSGPTNPNLVSFVPQATALFKGLTVLETIDYAARMRLPGDIGSSARARQVDDVLNSLGISDIAQRVVEKVSGGELKRVSIALEILTSPDLLILDEPTSGLDEGLDRSLMQLMRALAAPQRVVIAVTHATASLGLAGQVLALTRGEVNKRLATQAYVGRADGLKPAFDAPLFADVFDALRLGKTDRDQLPAPGGTQRNREPGSSTRVRRPISFTRTLRVNFQREVRRLGLQWKLLGLLVGVGPVLTGLLGWSIAGDGLGPMSSGPNLDLMTFVTAVCICLSFLAMSLSVTSAVADIEVMGRELRWGASPAAMIMARAAARAPLAAAQAVVAVAVLTVLVPQSEATVHDWPNAWGLAVVLVPLTLSSMTLGLAVGATSGTIDRAVSVMSAILAAMVVLCGAVIPLDDKVILDWSSLLMPTRWGVIGLASFFDAPRIASGAVDSRYSGDVAHLVWPAFAIAAIGLAALVVACLSVESGIRRLRTKRRT